MFWWSAPRRPGGVIPFPAGVTGGPGGFVTLVVHDETVAGHVWTPMGSYEIVPLGDGTHAVRKVNESADIQCGTAMAAEPWTVAETSPDGTDDGSVVDILVVWTPAAQDRVGGFNRAGEAAIRAKIDLAIAFTNDAFRRSGVFASLNLVGAERVDYEETYSGVDLSRLEDPKDGHLDDVLTLRDSVGADLVHLLWGRGGGRASVGGAFSASGGFYFAHEIGHNLGVSHARDDLTIRSYQHAFGDVSFGHGCATTITTNSGCGGFGSSSRTLPYYSSPALWDPRHGRPLGVSRFEPPGVLDGPADAVLTINRARHVVANFRSSRTDATATGAKAYLIERSNEGLDSPLETADIGNPDASVDIPDAYLRRAVERYLNKAPGDPITRAEMAKLDGVSTGSLDETLKGVRSLSGIEYAVNLTWLEAPNGSISDLSPLEELQGLSFLSLPRNYISDLTPLAGLLRLRRLELGTNYISNLTPLAGLELLVYLSLDTNPVSDLSVLRKLTNLEVLDLTSSQVHDLASLKDLSSLQELWLGDNSISDLAPLVNLQSLTRLELGHNNIVDLQPLVANRGLGDGDFLALPYNPLSVRSIDTHIPALTERGVEVNGPIGPSPEDQAWVAADPKLYATVQQAIENWKYSAVGVRVTVPDLAQIQYLDGQGRGIGNLAGLESAAGLQYLYLSDNHIVDLSPLSRLDSLHQLHLRGNEVSDLSPLAELHLLTTVSLANNQVKDLTPLANMDHLYWLALDGNKIRHLPALGTESLNYLHLVDNSIADIAPLAHLTTLRELRLTGNLVSSIEPLAGMWKLRYLHLNDNQVADIAPLNLESLVELHLKNNAVQDLSRLRNAEKLEMVDARDNPLSRDSLGVMADLRDAGVTVLAGESVPYFPAAGTVGRQGFARVVNRSAMAGEVFIEAVDDAGTRFGPVAVNMDARTALHFNSSDLEHGNRAKGLTGIGPPTAGDWRLELVSALDVEVLSYVRTEDGFVTAMHDVATRPMLPFVNPGGNERQRSFVRVVNVEGERGMWTSGGYDDSGRWHPMWEGVEVGPGRALTLTSSELENVHRLGEGRGKWWLRTRGFPWLSMGLLESPTGHLSNLSTVPDNATTLADGTRRHRVPLFLEAGGERDGFLRVINRSDAAGHVTINAVDDEGNARGPVRVAMRPLQTLHLNSGDLESGNAAKGLDGGVGLGEGDWRLALASELDLLVLAYIRTDDGFVTSMHDVAPRGADGSHRVVFFNPGSNERQVSKLRLINDGERAARVTITGIDDGGEDSGAATLNVPARRALYLTSAALEAGGGRIQGGLGDGAGKWRLRVDADAPLTVMSLLESPTGHLANVSTGTAD